MIRRTVAFKVAPFTLLIANMFICPRLFSANPSVQPVERPTELVAASASTRNGQLPRVHGSFSFAQHRTLDVGYGLSISRLREVPECASLFVPFDQSGEVMMSRALFVRPTEMERALFCSGGTAAFTQVGSPVTKLCPVFADLDRRTAALILIHEALHQAGMHESANGINHPSSEAINDLVRSACHL